MRANIDFAGWVVATERGTLLRIIPSPGIGRDCDTCGQPARYAFVAPDDSLTGVCQPCLDRSYEDDACGDEFYVPTKRRSHVTTYSDGGQQITVTIRQR